MATLPSALPGAHLIAAVLHSVGLSPSRISSGEYQHTSSSKQLDLAFGTDGHAAQRRGEGARSILTNERSSCFYPAVERRAFSGPPPGNHPALTLRVI